MKKALKRFIKLMRKALRKLRSKKARRKIINVLKLVIQIAPIIIDIIKQASLPS